MHHPLTCHAPFKNLVLAQTISQKQVQCTCHLHNYTVCHAHPTGQHIYARPLFFSTYYDVAKLQIVCGEQIQPHYLGNIQEFCSSPTYAVVLPR